MCVSPLDLSTYSTDMSRFRWLQCQLDEISKMKQVKTIRQALNKLPQGLEQTYERILINVPECNVDIVRRVLLWLAFSALPLPLEELHEMIAIEKDLPKIDEDALLSSPQDILDMCGSLLSVSDHDGKVKLAHLSVKDYLLSAAIVQSKVSSFALSVKESGEELAVDCLTYLSFSEFRSGPARTYDAYADRQRLHPAADHIARAWPQYVEAAGRSEALHTRVLRFFQEKSRPEFMSWVQTLNTVPGSDSHGWNRYPRHAHPLYYAASFGLDEAVQALIKGGAALDAPGSRFGGTALHAAVLRQRLRSMQHLLEAGANPNQADYQDITPLHTAAIYGNLEVIDLLLEYGASPRILDEYRRTPYDWAVECQQVETQERLLAALRDEESKTSTSYVSRGLNFVFSGH